MRATSPGAGSLQFTADSGGIKLVPGTQRAFRLTIYNGGGSQLAVHLITHGVPKEWLKLPPTPIELGPRQTFSGVLQVSPPAIAPPGAYPLNVTAQDRENSDLAASLDLTIELVEEEPVPAPAFVPISPVSPQNLTPAPVPAPRIYQTYPEQTGARAVITQTGTEQKRERKPRRLAPWGVGVVVTLVALLLCCGGAALAWVIFPQPVARPTLVLTPTMPPALSIDFRADRYSIPPGACANLQWQVNGALEARLDNLPVPLKGERQVCPQTTTRYTLLSNAGQSSVPRDLVIEVVSIQLTPVSPTVGPSLPPPPSPFTQPTFPPPPSFPAPPTWTATPVAPPIPPGIYVNSIRLDPPAPKKGQDITFIAGFVNTTGSEQTLRTCAEIFLAEEAKNSHGITPCQNRVIPIGTSEVPLDTWAARGIAGCMSYRARAIFISENNRIPFKRTDGLDYWLPYEVCP